MAHSPLRALVPDAPDFVCQLLDGVRGAIQPPIRSEIFGPQRFAQHGRSLGQTHRATRTPSRTANFFPRIKSNLNTLREAHHYIGLQASTGYDISPAAEWLLDNFHLIEAQLSEITAGLPRSYFRALPKLLDEPLAGLPRVYGVAWAFVAHTDGAFDNAMLVQFLSAYQEVRELGLSEMWALPTTLRVVLIENLRRLAERVATNKAAREVANLCFDKIDDYTPDSLNTLLGVLDGRGVGRVFLVQLAQRLQDLRPAEPTAEQNAFEEWLRHALPDLAAMQLQQGTDQAADNLSMSNAITSLRAISDADWPDIIARTSVLMRLMLSSPVFEAEDTATRDQTLHAIERLAKRSRQSEVAVAHSLLGLMNAPHGADEASSVAAYWLRGTGKPALWAALGLHAHSALAWQFLVSRLALPVYLATLLGSVGLVLWLMLRHSTETSMGLTLVGLVLALFPASEAVVAVIHRLISESVRPQHLPRLALMDGVPPEHRVMVVIPGMLTGAAPTRELVNRLQLHYLANPEPQAQFALLTDWADADTLQTDSDEPLLAQAVQGVRDLNALYPRPADEVNAAPRFIVLHRARLYSESEQRWIGWERKRGKLELLVAALARGISTEFLDLGDASAVAHNTRYIVTLDSDTQLPPGRLRELVGVAAHPHNQPRLDPDGLTVVSGYGILQPRVATPLPAVKEFTLYHWLFAGQCGIDPYSAASSEIYQDVFSEGTFTGKGLLNVRAMYAVLSNRLPQDQVLSHDLLEGSIARCAAVSDIAVLEDAPFHADVAASRVHRWTRGDWQLLPFLLSPGTYSLRAIHLWKMVDNLRRSLVAPMSLGLLLTTLAGAAMSPWVALVLVYGAFTAGPVMGAMAGFAPSRDDVAKSHFYRAALQDLVRALCGGLWLVAQLLQHARLALDAIGRALYRMTVSHRHLLQWTTAAAAQAQARTDLSGILRQHRLEPLLATVLFAALWWAHTPTPWLASGLCLLWAGSPLWTWWVSRAHSADKDARLPEAELIYLNGIARDTWRFFERCVGHDDRHLPPDNLQSTPHDIVAHRTSPTNIGLYLLSVACARQFGWIGTQDLLTRLEATLGTLLTLQRHRGHFMNWYDTQSGEPLLPMYVSTVDSGNLSGHLLALAQACRELANAPLDGRAGLQAIETSRQRLAPLLTQRSTLLAAQREELRWLLADHRATVVSARQDALAKQDPDAGEAMAQQRLARLATALEQLAWQPDFGFLYSRRRHLFHIGYRVAEHQRDAGFYDLLASESRLTSLLAIAKGDVPVRHWSTLGRPFFSVGAAAGLRSWTGSMFEYLMPGAVLHEPYGSALHEACHAALREQMTFAKAQGVPWGISESAYAASDFTLAYQYAPHGVPRLALRRTPTDELVIAPYATALAAQISPHGAVLNFKILQELGARGRYGFLEALDYSAAGRTGNEPFTPVDTVMAHHQGMSIVALSNVLLEGAAQRWGMANAHVQAVSSLLQERVPREIPVLAVLPAQRDPQAQRRRSPGFLHDVFPGTNAVEPTHLLSNGRYSVELRANGAGCSRWGQTGISRWRDDALRDLHGSFFYVQWQGQAQPFSITQHPAPDEAANYQSVFHADRVCFDAHWPDLQAHTTVWVSPEDDIEFRQVELRNLSDHTLEVELTSAFEVTLSDPRADESHPAFTNLFVTAQWLASQQTLWFERKPRLPSEEGLKVAHFLTDMSGSVTGVRLATDRQRWQGRNQGASLLLAGVTAAPETPDDPITALDTGLDPVCVLAVTLRIAPGAKARLTFATTASLNTQTLQAVIDKYRQASNVQRASLMSATLTGIRLRALRISAENFSAMQTLTTALVMSLTRVQARAVRPESAATEVCDRRLLWRFGLSGDRPIILVLAGVSQGLGLLRSLSQTLNLWSWSHLACDLVVVNAEPSSYLMPMQRDIAVLRDRHSADCGVNGGQTSTGFYLIRSDELSRAELSTLHALARVRLHADGRPLAFHVQELNRLHDQAQELRLDTSTTALNMAPVPASGVTPSQGEFAPDSGEFGFAVSAGQRPLRPWINVLANPSFGAQISEAGGGYTWAINSRLNQLTAWSNDPVGDPPSEWFLLQNSKTREVWRLTPSAGVEEGITFQVAHGQGYSAVSHQRGDIEVKVVWCVDAQTRVKHTQVTLVNHGHKTKHLRLIGMVEWLMGANRSDRGTVRTAAFHQRLPAPLQKLTALLATQRELAAGFGGGTAFFGMANATDETDDWTCDRREFFDGRGRLGAPDFLGQRSGDGLDPCAALSTELTLVGGAAVTHTFLLGYAENADAARRLATLATQTSAQQRLEQVRGAWHRLLGAVTVQTPDPLLDAMVNHWLLYQTVSCRLWAKAGFYQAGGATGFRDQLQDAMAMSWTAPDMLRKQIVVCASRQFVQGDVQHWWHAPLGNGVRTHFSDDLLWLAHACVHYLHTTGDDALLDQQVPFLEGPAIAAGAEDAYFTPTVTEQTVSVYEHAARAIDRSLQVGAHGLPLMGSGDWNDGMNRVGIEGRGESVWLGWFLCQLVDDFAPLAHQRADHTRAARWEQATVGWRTALAGAAWDGQWFKRAFFDDGQALGSKDNPEGQIDLIAQAWSVLSQTAPVASQRLAMAAVEARLVDHEAGLIKLLDPPLVNATPSAGYIQAYPPGVRENGGQYSHAGVWALMAQAELATHDTDSNQAGDLAYRYFSYLSPAHRANHPVTGSVYGIEPYVMAGDVYTQAPYVGRGGWSWYTGAAAWMHRAAIESIFGLSQQAQTLLFTPCLPSHWPQAELTLVRDDRTMRFILVRANEATALAATAQWGAQLLHPGQSLHWTALTGKTCFVIPTL